MKSEHKRPRLWLRSTATALLCLATVSGCGTNSGSEIAALQAIASTCPAGQQLASLVSVDASGSARSDALDAVRKDVIADVARRTAVCGGHLRVTAFSSSAAATATIFDGDLHPTGATDIAKLRRVPDLVAETMASVDAAFAPTVASLSPNGTDVVSQFGLAREFLNQVNAAQSGGQSAYRLNLVILTDGQQSVGLPLVDPNLTAERGAELASTVTAPDLSGAEVTVAGVGKMAGDLPPTSYVDGLKAFYGSLCTASGAASCVVVTDFVPAGS